MAYIYDKREDFWGAQITELYDDFALSYTSHGTPIQVVCDLGDVVLVADDGVHPAQKMKVSTVVLSVASKVFKTLFSGSFAETEAIRNSPHAAIEIRINDHPSDALLLCQLLHFHGNLDKLGYERFLGLAVIIDKYDCIEALRHVVYGKLAALKLDNVDQREHLYYATAAWILDQPKFFRQFTKEMVVYYESGPTEESDVDLDVLPTEILASIRSQRDFAGRELIYHLSNFIAKYHTAACSSGFPAYSNELTQSMLACDLWPLDLSEDKCNTLSCLFHELKEYHLPVMKADKLEWTKPETDATRKPFEGYHLYIMDVNEMSALMERFDAVEPPTKFELNHIVEQIELFCVGLCLDCFKGNETCRVPHSDPFSEDLWIPLRRMDQDGRPDHGADTKRPESWESVW